MTEELREGQGASPEAVPPYSGNPPAVEAVPPYSGNPPAVEAVPPSGSTITEEHEVKALRLKVSMLEAELRVANRRRATEIDTVIGVVMATLGEKLFTLSVEEISKFHDNYETMFTALQNGDIEYRVVRKGEVK